MTLIAVNRLHFYSCGYSKCVSVSKSCFSVLIVELEISKHQFLRNKKTIHSSWLIGFPQYVHLSPENLRLEQHEAVQKIHS